jgi:hypothetical protein
MSVSPKLYALQQDRMLYSKTEQWAGKLRRLVPTSQGFNKKGHLNCQNSCDGLFDNSFVIKAFMQIRALQIPMQCGIGSICNRFGHRLYSCRRLLWSDRVAMGASSEPGQD